MKRSQCELLAEVAGRIGWAFRMKLRSEPEPAPWCPWIIEPVAAYLETGDDGPYPARELEWVDIEPTGDAPAAAAEFAAVELQAEVLEGFIRVTV